MATNEKQWDFLREKFKVGQLGHSYLISGNDAQHFSREFAKLINCLSRSPRWSYGEAGRSPQAKADSSDLQKPCQICQNCKMIEKGIFPDLLFVKSSNSASSLKDGSDKMEIDVSQIRSAQNFLAFTPYYGNYKAVIIDDAERMNVQSQNCFLKTLEEPRGKTVIFLNSQKPVLLLPTIFSRCQEIKLSYQSSFSISKEEQSAFNHIKEIIHADLSEKFKYAKGEDLQGEHFIEIISILRRYFRGILLSKIGIGNLKSEKYSALKTPVVESKAFTTGQVKKILELIEEVSCQATTFNINNKLALEILLLET